VSAVANSPVLAASGLSATRREVLPTADAGTQPPVLVSGPGSAAGTGAVLHWSETHDAPAEESHVGGGGTVLIGGDGDSLHIGGEGRDVLIGGIGSDEAAVAGEVPFGAVTALEAHAAALRSVLSEWAAGSDPLGAADALLSGYGADGGLGGEE
jgi:hypothetical protein